MEGVADLIDHIQFDCLKAEVVEGVTVEAFSIAPTEGNHCEVVLLCAGFDEPGRDADFIERDSSKCRGCTQVGEGELHFGTVIILQFLVYAVSFSTEAIHQINHICLVDASRACTSGDEVIG